MLQSIQRQTGLPLFFDPPTGTIKWESGVEAEKISSRSFAEMRYYTAEPEAKATGDPVYLMYRGVTRNEDRGKIKSAGLRYDITVIPPGHFIGRQREFFRTAGHYHPVKPGTAAVYPEVYEVISGRAYWLIQKPKAGDPKAIEQIFAVEAGPGEKAVILPGFGHMSVNAFDQPLIMANWISDGFAYNYAPYKNLRGSAYWMIEGAAAGTIEFIKNKNYSQVPDLHKLRPREIKNFGFLRKNPLYSLSGDLDKLSFLNAPEKFIHMLTVDQCYQYVLS